MNLKSDYRGLKLCGACWNGVHFTTRLKGQKICLCELGDCECPCKNMQENLAEQLQKKKAERKKVRKSQLSIHGCASPEIPREAIAHADHPHAVATGMGSAEGEPRDLGGGR